MSWPNAHETLPVVARITSQTVTAAATVTSDIIDMRYWQECIAYVNLGAYASGNDGSVAVKVTMSNDGSGFTSPADMASKSITSSLFTGSTGDEQVAVLRWRNEEMSLSGTEYRYARVELTPTNKNLTTGVIVVGVGGRYQPGSDYDIAAVAQIVA